MFFQSKRDPRTHLSNRIEALESRLVLACVNPPVENPVEYNPDCAGIHARVELAPAPAGTTNPRQLTADDLQSSDPASYIGQWEYVYDVWGGYNSWTRFVTLKGFAADEISNLHTATVGDIDLDGNGDGNSETGVWQRWDTHTTGGYALWSNFQENSIYPSYWNGSEWEERSYGNWPGQNEDFYAKNLWHSGSDYNVTETIWGSPLANFRRYPGIPKDFDAGIPGNDALEFDSFVHTHAGWGWSNNSLELTFRVVHPSPPGEITWETYHNGDVSGLGGITMFGTVVGPALAAPNDPPTLGDTTFVLPPEATAGAVGTLFAEDDPTQTLTYTITDDPSGLFSLSPTGELTLSSDPTDDRYVLEVSVADDADPPASESATVTVLVATTTITANGDDLVIEDFGDVGNEFTFTLSGGELEISDPHGAIYLDGVAEQSRTADGVVIAPPAGGIELRASGGDDQLTLNNQDDALSVGFDGVNFTGLFGGVTSSGLEQAILPGKSGDTLSIDMTAAAGPVLIGSGWARSEGGVELSYSGFDTVDLTDGPLANGFTADDFYFRGTDESDRVIFREGAGEFSIDLTIGRHREIVGPLPEFPGMLLLDAAGGDDLVSAQVLSVPTRIEGGAGNDFLYGGDGDDEIHGGDGANYIYGFDGNNILTGGPLRDTLIGGSGNDILSGGGDRDYLRGFGGHDLLLGEDGDDYLDGGDGNDLLNGSVGRDRLFGGDGDDVLLAGSGRDDLRGDAGSDFVLSGSLTSYENSSGTQSLGDLATLDALLADWQAGDVRSVVTIHGSEPDRVFGGPDGDAFAVGARDRVYDRRSEDYDL